MKNTSSKETIALNLTIEEQQCLCEIVSKEIESAKDDLLEEARMMDEEGAELIQSHIDFLKDILKKLNMAKQPIDKVMDLLEANGPFEGTFTCGGRSVERIRPGDARLVGINRWDLHRDGNACEKGTDILAKRKTEYGQNILYVKFSKPNTHWLDENQVIYRITLNS